MTNTSESYVVFGHGRRQCPGRWIFAHIFKVLIAEMLLNYEIKPFATRPKIHSKFSYLVIIMNAALTLSRMGTLPTTAPDDETDCATTQTLSCHSELNFLFYVLNVFILDISRLPFHSLYLFMCIV